MDIENIIFFVLGAFASWGISHYYYNRGNREVPRWLLPGIKEILAKNPDDIDWTAKQIVNLYNDKIFNLGLSDPLPFNYCPKCGSDKLKHSSFTDEKRDNVYYSVECGECRWSDWTQ